MDGGPERHVFFILFSNVALVACVITSLAVLAGKRDLLGIWCCLIVRRVRLIYHKNRSLRETSAKFGTDDV